MADEDLDRDVAARLRRADHRYTRGRRRLVESLRAGGGPMTMAQILKSDDGLAQSSVYRNLVVLEEVDAVTRIVTRDDFARYELAEDLTEHHHHLICSTCGDVSDFSLTPSAEDDLDRALRRAATKAGFTVAGHQLDLIGVCAACT